MKIRFAVGPHAGSPSGAQMAAFAESLELAGFDGLWLSDLPVAAVLDPLLGLSLAAGRTRRLHLGANLVPSAATRSCWPRSWPSSMRSRAADSCSASSPASVSPASARRSGSMARGAATCWRRYSGCCGAGGRARRSTIAPSAGRPSACHQMPRPVQDPPGVHQRS